LTEIGGYATRLFSHYRPFNLAAFIASFSMIVMAPVIYTAAVDFTLNMLVEGFGPETQAILLLPPRWLIVIFISTDVLSGQSSVTYLYPTHYTPYLIPLE
jgi:hypothetical protein